MKLFIALLLVFLNFTLCFGQKMADRDFAGLKGSVKLIEETEEKLSPKASKEEQADDIEYDKAGNEVKKSNYEFGSRTIYFFLNGTKVSRSEQFAESKFKPELIGTIVGNPDATLKPEEKPKLAKEKKKVDDRFEYRYEYKYDSVGRIIRETEFTNTGELDSVTEYSYDKEGRIATETNKNKGQGTFKDSYKYDTKGLLSENLSSFYTENGAEQFTLSYKYSEYKLDPTGNWIQRKESEKHADDPNEVPNVTIQRRRLTYF